MRRCLTTRAPRLDTDGPPDKITANFELPAKFKAQVANYRENLKELYIAVSRTYTDGGETKNPTRYWGADHWASRGGQGTYFNWIVGNALLPDVDPNPEHEGIQKIDRTTVPELTELATTMADMLTQAMILMALVDFFALK